MTKTFILGLGAHKSGTTWIAKNLKNAGVNFPLRKEARIWNNLDLKHDQTLTSTPQSIEKLDQKIYKAKKQKSHLKNSKYKKQKKILQNPQKYFTLMSQSALNSPVNCVGDITPIYCKLNTDFLKIIKQGLEEVGFNVKVLFIMRDPIERVWSATRMAIGRKQDSNQVFNNDKAYKLLDLQYKSEPFRTRTCYEATIHNIRQVFKEDDYKVLFFEEIIKENSFYKIQLGKFLGFNLRPNFGRSSNTSPSFGPLPEELRNKIALEYKDTYSFVAENYPNSKNIWKKSFQLFQ